MDTIYSRCAGPDVHKETVQACVRLPDERGKVGQQVRQFGTTTGELLKLRQWLVECRVTHAAMESTGVYWKPVWNVLEEADGLTLLLVNARHIKQVPGRKSDVKDSQWIAQLLQHGLLRNSFVPPAEQRQWRDLTRHRVKVVAQATQTANRIQKVLEDANIKLGSVATDVLGVSGREMIRLMIEGVDDPVVLASCARGRLKGKTAELREALAGRLAEHHRFMPKLLADQLEQLAELLRRRLDERLDTGMAAYARQIELLDTIPGVDKIAARAILAEIGPDMNQFPTADHLASWAGMCPGLHESAGKRQSGKPTKGNRWLRRVLVQAGWAASRSKGTYLAAQFHRLVGRRGRKRTLVSVGHSILVSAYHMLKNDEEYRDPGADHFVRLQPERLTRQLVKRLEALGHRVTLTPAA